MFGELKAKAYELIIISMAVILAVSIVFGFYQKIQHNRYKDKSEKAEQTCLDARLKDREKFIGDLAEKQDKINEISKDYEDEKSKVKVKVETVTKEVVKIVERPVYSNACIDDDGMHSINSLISKSSK